MRWSLGFAFAIVTLIALAYGYYLAGVYLDDIGLAR